MNSTPGTESFLEQNSIKICYKTFGIPSNPVIILMMGIGGQLIQWPDQITQGLAHQGFYVITFDNRDSGLSCYYDHLFTPDLIKAILAKKLGKPFHPPYTLNDMAHDVVVLMDKLSIPKAHIVGLSMGGMIGQIIALEYQERVLSLTCIASTSGDAHLPPSKPKVLQFFLTRHSPAENLDSYVKTMIDVNKIYNHPDDFNEKYARDLYTRSYQRAFHPEGFKRQLLAVLFAAPRGEQLRQLKLKSLVIHGDYDPVFPLEHGKQLAQCLHTTAFTVIEKMGHALPERVHKTIVELIAKHNSQNK